MNIVTAIIKPYIDVMYTNIEKKQIRKSKCNIVDVFKMMIASSFGNNFYSNFTHYYNLDSASSGNLSYWTVKIYDYDISYLYKQCYTSYINLDKNKVNDISNNHYVTNTNSINRNSLIENDLKAIFDKYNVLV